MTMSAGKSGAIRNRLFIHLFLILFCLIAFIIPFWLVISISFTSEEALLNYGYKLIPKDFSITAYQFVFKNPQKLLDAYGVTAAQAVIGTFLAVLVMALCAYPLSRSSFRLKKPITFYIFFTMLFGGGLIPSYILNTVYLRLGNKLWIYILPCLANAFYIIIFRTFFQGLSASLVESAKIDGASELRIFFRIIFPLSTPVMATISLLFLLDRWNDWYTSLIYIRKENLFTLQYLLQKILMEAEFISRMAAEFPVGADLNAFKVPTEGMRFAMCIVAAGPMLVIFPFFQKYFAQGLTIGAVKG